MTGQKNHPWPSIDCLSLAMHAIEAAVKSVLKMPGIEAEAHLDGYREWSCGALPLLELLQRSQARKTYLKALRLLLGQPLLPRQPASFRFCAQRKIDRLSL